MVCADHGPAVSGAHNTIVASRAGKDLVSSLCSGLLTIGPRFGGALDDAARMFTKAADGGVDAKQWVTDMKKANLILNVDGCIACCFVDMLRSSGAFTLDEINDLVDDGCLNGLFVLSRSIGLIGHFLDQKRMKQPLYRHPWDDITYLQQ